MLLHDTIIKHTGKSDLALDNTQIHPNKASGNKLQKICNCCKALILVS